MIDWNPLFRGSALPFVLLLTHWVKRVDRARRLKRWSSVFPIVFGFLASALLTEPFDWRQFIFWGLFDGFGAAWIYSFGVKTLFNLGGPSGNNKS